MPSQKLTTPAFHPLTYSLASCFHLISSYLTFPFCLDLFSSLLLISLFCLLFCFFLLHSLIPFLSALCPISLPLLSNLIFAGLSSMLLSDIAPLIEPPSSLIWSNLCSIALTPSSDSPLLPLIAYRVPVPFPGPSYDRIVCACVRMFLWARPCVYFCAYVFEWVYFSIVIVLCTKGLFMCNIHTGTHKVFVCQRIRPFPIIFCMCNNWVHYFSLTPLMSLQYYEMSYGLNIEMHKQVSALISYELTFINNKCLMCAVFGPFIRNKCTTDHSCSYFRSHQCCETFMHNRL